MPGKINLKQFNNISDVFSRMNLGQRSANSTFDDVSAFPVYIEELFV